MILHIFNIFVHKTILKFIIFFSVFYSLHAEELSNWEVLSSSNSLALYENNVDKSRLSIAIVPTNNDSARQYAVKLMELYEGHNLRPIPKLRAWQFAYASNVPCSIIVYHENQEFFKVVMLCGKTDLNQLESILSKK